MTDNYPIDNIHGSDEVNLTWDLAKIVAVHRRENPPPKVEFISRRPVPRIVYSARVDLVYHAPRKMKASLKLYNEAGEIIRTYFNPKDIHAGLHIYTVGINNILEKAEKFTARLEDEEGNEIASTMLDNEVPYDEVVQQITRVNFEYIVRKSGKISMLVFDMNDNLLQEIFMNRPMTLSKRNANFKFYHALKDQDGLKVKVFNETDEVIHEQIVKI